MELAPKHLEISRELVPNPQRALFVCDAADRHAVSQLDSHRGAAHRLGAMLVERPRTQDGAGAVLDRVRKHHVDGILSPRCLSSNTPGFIIETEVRRAMPTMLHSSSEAGSPAMPRPSTKGPTGVPSGGQGHADRRARRLQPEIGGREGEIRDASS